MRSILVAAFLAASLGVSAQEGGGERLALGLIGGLGAELGMDAEISVLSERPVGLGADFELDASVSKRGLWSLTLRLPASILAGVEDSGPRARASLGDPGLSLAGWLGSGSLRFRADIGYSYPLGIWDPRQVAETGVAGGSGYHRASLGVSSLAIRDPAMVALRLGWSTGWRDGAEGLSWRPADLSLSASMTEALNAFLSATAALSLSFCLPPMVGGAMAGSGAYAQVGFSVGFSWRSGPVSIRAGGAGSSVSGSGSRLCLGASYSFEEEP